MTHTMTIEQEKNPHIVIYGPTEQTPRDNAPYAAEDERAFTGMIKAHIADIERLAREHEVQEAHFLPYRPFAEDADISHGGPFLTCYAVKSPSAQPPHPHDFAEAVTELTGVGLDTRRKGHLFTRDVERDGLKLEMLHESGEAHRQR